MSPRLLAAGATLAPVKERSRVEAECLVYRKSDPKLPEIGARLALTRRALDLTRFQMARLLGTNMPTWGTYEGGPVQVVDQPEPPLAGGAFFVVRRAVCNQSQAAPLMRGLAGSFAEWSPTSSLLDLFGVRPKKYGDGRIGAQP